MNFFGWGRNKSVEDENPSLEPIEKAVKNSEEDQGYSVTDRMVDDSLQGIDVVIPGAESVHDFIAAPVSTNKEKRLSEYRVMSNHVEMSDAIDEICDSMLNVNDQGRFTALEFKVDRKINDKQKEILQKEFDYIMSLFDLGESGYNYCRQFVVEGEVTFENVINPLEANKGILSLKHIDNDRYELLKDLKTGNIIGILCNIEKKDAHQLLSPEYASGMNFFREIDISGQAQGFLGSLSRDDRVPLLFSQITYVNTGIYDKNKTFVYPPLDRARQAYKQLTLIEDGVIIYRVARSPERLVFNIASGSTPASKAQQMLLQMIKRFNMRKTTRQGVNGERGVSNTYDAHQVVESFWFLKPSDGQGSDVASIGGPANFGELEDLKFFTRKLYRSMKVPFSRFEQPEHTISQGEDITYEEYRFAKFVVRLQQSFASAIRETFYTHLKLKGLWKQYNLNSRDMNIKFMPPAVYELYQVAKLNEMKMTAYSEIADNADFSHEIAMRKILGMSDEEISENNHKLFDEAIQKAMLEFWVGKVKEWGTLAVAKKKVKEELGVEEVEEGPGSDATIDSDKKDTNKDKGQNG